MKQIALLFAVLGLMAASAAAEDEWDPPWDRTDAAATYVRWDFPTDLTTPVELINEFGDPEIEWPGLATPQEIMDWEGTEITTWHIGGVSGGISQVTIWVPNKEDENLKKQIQWQVTSDKAVPAGGAPGPGVTVPGAGGTPTPGNPTYTPYGPRGLGGNWYIYAGLVEIEPNPKGEWLTFDVVECTNIEEIVIDTICIPEPATLGLMGFGGLMMLLRRRRR